MQVLQVYLNQRLYRPSSAPPEHFHPEGQHPTRGGEKVSIWHNSHGGSEQVVQAQAGEEGNPVERGLVWEVEPTQAGRGRNSERGRDGPAGKPGRPRGRGQRSG